MDLTTKIMECQMAAELTALENLFVLTKHEQEVVLTDWRMKNERLGFVADLTDT